MNKMYNNVYRSCLFTKSALNAPGCQYFKDAQIFLEATIEVLSEFLIILSTIA